jgi:tRNA(Arg) A34 adenosine deaminase TadA
LPHLSVERVVGQSAFILNLPDWIQEFVSSRNPSFATLEERMDFVIELSRLNSLQGTGGPFAASIFDLNDGSLFASGVNLVVSGQCSVLHAEIVTLMFAQKKAGTYDLSSAGSTFYELITSTEPCAMCLGAVTWSGIRKVVCGARGADAEEAGFDEGEKPHSWVEALERRGISVLKDVGREKAATVLRDYRATGGIIYNPRYRTSHGSAVSAARSK